MRSRPRQRSPLEGKGDRFAVDEVTCEPAPLRKAFFAAKSELPNKKDASSGVFFVLLCLCLFQDSISVFLLYAGNSGPVRFFPIHLLLSMNLQQLIAEDPGGDQ